MADSVGGQDVAESSLGKVPNADKLDGLDSTAFLTQKGAVFTDAGLPDATQPCPKDSTVWANDGERAAYYRAPDGLVLLRDYLRACPQAHPFIFNLPRGYRPETDVRNAVARNDVQNWVIKVAPNGRVTAPGFPIAFGAAQDVGLDGVFFRCGPSGQNGCP